MTMTAHLQTPQATPVSTQKVDLLIVGAGASGCLLAAKLATAGKKVVILEAGPDIGTKDMVSSQIWSRRWRWNGAPTEGGGAVGAAFNSGWGGGGSASHHYAVWLRLHEEDFQVKSRFGVGNDWPLTYGDLRPFYDRIQEEVGISGDAKAEIWRPEGDPYPMPPLTQMGQGKAIARGFEKIGVRTAPTPVAINSTAYKGRPPCVYDGWCDAGCPVGALANPLVVHLPAAEAAGVVLTARATMTGIASL
ncbi:MAG: FAD-dependent oxidoreductase, partial [Thermomicrobiales bacterium]